MAAIKSIEEKAKRYDEAMKAAVIAHKDEDRHLKATLERIFPELKESEDEKIRKELVQFFKEKDEEDFEEWIPKAKVLAWLEKQGKQKETLCDKCKKTQPSHSCQDITALGRCALEKQDEQKLTDFEKSVKQVMEEAIECGDTRNLKADAEMLLSLVHNSSWSEEDEKILSDIIKDLVHPWNEYIPDRIEDEIIWLKNRLKSLKDRVQPQPKQEWSKDSKRKMYRIYSILGQAADTHAFSTTCRLIGDKECIELQDFLKALIPQSTWKPSDKQMITLRQVISGCSYDIEPLVEMEEQLKKLRDE